MSYLEKDDACYVDLWVSNLMFDKLKHLLTSFNNFLSNVKQKKQKKKKNPMKLKIYLVIILFRWMISFQFCNLKFSSHFYPSIVFVVFVYSWTPENLGSYNKFIRSRRFGWFQKVTEYIYIVQKPDVLKVVQL